MTWLDDLELWSSRKDANKAIDSLQDRNRFELAMPIGTHVRCIEDIQDDMSPAHRSKQATSVLCHLMLDSHKENCAFLYCFPSGISLHIPEYFFITGDLEHDADRMQHARGVASAVRRFFGVTWENASFGGHTVPIHDEESFWSSYFRDLYERFEHSPLEM